MISTSPTEAMFGFCVNMHEHYLQVWIEKKKSYKGSSIIMNLWATLALQLWQFYKQIWTSEVHNYGIQCGLHNQNHEQAAIPIKPKWQCVNISITTLASIAQCIK